MSETRIDLPEVLEDLQAIVSEAGDGFVYASNASPECDYIRDNKPSCIVGHVLARHNLLHLEVAQQNEGMCGGLLAVYEQDPHDYAPAEMFQYFTPEAIRALAIAQEVQDQKGATWGDALIAAKQVSA